MNNMGIIIFQNINDAGSVMVLDKNNNKVYFK